MKFAIGNEKLGKGCLVVSRPVGDTCPDSCQFLGNGCYAEKIEKRFPNARVAGEQNLSIGINPTRAMILQAAKQGKSIRWHERGDFLINGKIDVAYVQAIADTCEQILAEGKTLPDMWVYTHVYSSFLHEKLSPYITMYASIHNAEDKKAAESAGFRLFAWCDTDDLFPNRGKGGNPDVPKLAIIDDTKYITCPEMRRGRAAGGVTCTGGKDTVACNLCVRGLANVLFLNH